MPSDDFKDDDELFKRFSSRDNENYKGDRPDDDKMKSPFGEEDSHEEENDYDENDREENGEMKRKWRMIFLMIQILNLRIMKVKIMMKVGQEASE